MSPPGCIDNENTGETGTSRVETGRQRVRQGEKSEDRDQERQGDTERVSRRKTGI